MKTSHDTKAFAFALQQTWLDTPDPLAEISEDTLANLVDYLLVTEPSSTLPSFYEHRILERLHIAPSSPTLGELLQGRLASVSPEWQTEQTGFSLETIKSICQDAIAPTSIPIMRMKRLAEFLELSVKEILVAIQETAYRYQKQHQANINVAYAPMGRLPIDNWSNDMANGGDDKLLFEYDEALRVYLELLSHELTNSDNLPL